MDDKWKGLLFNLLKYEAENDSNSPLKGRKKIGRRGGRGGRALMKEFVLEGVDSLLEKDDDYDYRLASLLTHKTIMGEQWDNNWNSKINQLRSKCEANGVHPVFHLLSSTFKRVLSEMEIYDVREEQIDEDYSWLEKCRIDPTDIEMLIELLRPPLGIHLNATTLAPLKRLYEQMKRKGNVKPQWLAKQLDSRLLSERYGGVGLLAAMLMSSAQMDGTKERFELLSKENGVVGEIAKEQLYLIKIREGDTSIWQECINLESGNSLYDACRSEAWAIIPVDTMGITVEKLKNALCELNAWMDIRDYEIDNSRLRWFIVKTMSSTNDMEEIDEIYHDLIIKNNEQLKTSLSLLETNIHNVVIEKLEEVIESYQNLDLSLILQYESIPIKIRLEVSELLGIDGSAGEYAEEMMLELYTREGDIGALTNLLSSHVNGAQIHPHLSLIAGRLIGAESNPKLIEWVSNARLDAFLMLSDVTKPDFLSTAAVELTSLLDGGAANLEEIGSLLSAEGLQAFKQCRRAMMEDGDGLVPETLLDKLNEAVVSSSMGIVEKKLFEQLILNLKLNKADSLLQGTDPSNRLEAEIIIEDVMLYPPTYRLLNNINGQVVEHGVSSLALDKWYKSNNSNSMEASIASGRLYEKNRDFLQAARAYHTASIRCDDFELRQKLNKEALVSFAHAGNWPEAIGLLRSETGLKTNITENFNLYLKVNEEANSGKLESARDMILASVRNIRIIEKVSADGDKYESEESYYSEEDLNLLLTYPSIHRLPGEPFRGRVLAAINWVQKGQRRKGRELESDFQQALNRREFTEILNVANKAYDERGPEHGLLFYERAINSGKFDENGIQKLSQMQHTMYSRPSTLIPIRKRVHLSNLELKPLVIVDTNLLVDALVERVLNQLNLELDVPLHLDSLRQFHKTLLYRLNQDKIEMHIPPAARNELRTIAKIPNRIRNICGDRLVNPKLWDDKINEKILLELANQTIKEYNSWNPPKNEGVNDLVQGRKNDLEMFFVSLRDVFSEITDAKIERGHAQSKRYEIKGEAFYPESGDIDIMLLAAHLAEQCEDGFGSILVASRDSDFTYPARAFQERFGFVIIDNAKALSHYTH